MVSELRDRELEPVEGHAQVGNSSPSGMELIAEFAQAGKTVTRHGVLQIYGKVRTNLARTLDYQTFVARIIQLSSSAPVFSHLRRPPHSSMRRANAGFPAGATGLTSLQHFLSRLRQISSCCTGRLSKMVSFREDMRHSSHSLKLPY